MEVVYKKSMVGRVEGEIYKAKMINKEIDKIILTMEEWEELYKELHLLYPYIYPSCPKEPHKLGGAIAKYNDIQIFVQ